MAKNQVTLTFAGDAKSLERAAARGGKAVKDMAADMDKAGGQARSFGGAVDSAGARVGAQEQKFMGAADVLDGLNTAFGLGFDQAISYARAAGDVAGGVENLRESFSGAAEKVEGWIKSMITGTTTSQAQALATGEATVAIGANTVATEANATATKSASIWQRAWNLAMSANPVLLIVTAIAALGTALVVAYKKSETFRRIVNGAFNTVKKAAEKALSIVQGIVDAIKKVLTWLGLLDTKGEDSAKKFSVAMGDVQKDAARAARAAGAEVPANFVGGRELVGGGSHHTGGVVPGPMGAPRAIMALGGERVLSPGQSAGASSITINVQAFDGRDAGAKVAEALREYQRRNGQVYALA